MVYPHAHGHVRSLPEVRRDCVRGIADERDAIVSKPGQWIVQVVPAFTFGRDRSTSGSGSIHMGLQLIHIGLRPISVGLCHLHIGLQSILVGLQPIHIGLRPIHIGSGPIHIRKCPACKCAYRHVYRHAHSYARLNKHILRDHRLYYHHHDYLFQLAWTQIELIPDILPTSGHD